MYLIKDIIAFINSLNKIDLLLYFAIIVLFILIISLVYIIKNSDYEEEMLLEEDNDNLKNIVNALEKEKPKSIELTDYEKEQEEKAIISYEELLATKELKPLTYEDTPDDFDEIKIKKVNLDSLINKKEEKKPIAFFNYEREEEFLQQLKLLNKLIN